VGVGERAPAAGLAAPLSFKGGALRGGGGPFNGGAIGAFGTLDPSDVPSDFCAFAAINSSSKSFIFSEARLTFSSAAFAFSSATTALCSACFTFCSNSGSLAVTVVGI